MSSFVAPTVKFNNGEAFPQIGLGTWQLDNDADKSSADIKSAIDMGYRMIDTAAFYNTEKIIGTAVNAKIAEGVIRREDIFITSKIWVTEHKPGNFVTQCQKSLENLGLEYLDLYLIHWPFSLKENFEDQLTDSKDTTYDETMTVEEKWLEMEKCVKAGLVRSIGVSNFNSQQIDSILKVATIKPVTNQVECHPYFNQKKLIDFCRKREIIITAYAPFGSPSRPKSTFYGNVLNLLEDEKLKQIALKNRKTPAQMVLRYLIELGTVPIPKSSNTTRMSENLNVFDFSLKPEDVAFMDSLNRNLRSFPTEMAKDHRDYPFNIEF